MAETHFSHETHRLAYDQSPGHGPGVVFLSGFNSNKDGTKALHLEAWAQKQDRAFLRFDYSGHGASSGRFEDGTITTWTRDAATIISGVTDGPQVLVGSSMGGWIACLLARQHPEQIAGIVTIAGAPDFTEDRYWAGFDTATRAALASEGAVDVQSPYDAQPYRITRDLIEDGRRNLIFSDPLSISCPMRILHGTEDDAIPVETALRLFNHVKGRDVQVTLVKGADHRFSTPPCLDLIEAAIEDVTQASAKRRLH
ncbi:MAG: alpha/beta hydrolase [Pseudomonadota bacterium]